MKRTVLVLLYTLGITVICYPCQAEPTPFGYDYLGVDKSNPEPKRKPNANGLFSQLGRNWSGPNSGLTLTNEQQQYTPKNEVVSPNGIASDLYESSEGLIFPNVLSGHNLNTPKKELSNFKSLNGWSIGYEPKKVAISKRPQYASNNELVLSNSLHEFDVYEQDSWNHLPNEQKKGLTLSSPNGKDSSELDMGFILSDGYKQYEPGKEMFLSNSGEYWIGLNGGISWSDEPNKKIQWANKKKLSLPKAVGHIWFKPNVDLHFPKKREEKRLWVIPTKGIIIKILTGKINNDVSENVMGNLEKLDYTIKVVMRHQEGTKLNNKVKDDILLTLTMPIGRFRTKQRTTADSTDSTVHLDGGHNSQGVLGFSGKEIEEPHHKILKCPGKSKKKDKNKKRFEVVHDRRDCPKKKKKKSKKKPKKHINKKKRFEIVDSLKGQHIRRPDMYWSNYYKRPNHYFK